MGRYTSFLFQRKKKKQDKVGFRVTLLYLEIL